MSTITRLLATVGVVAHRSTATSAALTRSALFCLAIIAGCAVFTTTPDHAAQAQAIPDVSGPWPITTTPDNRCITEVTQTGGTLGGQIQCEGLGVATLVGNISPAGVFGFTSNFSLNAVSVQWSGTATAIDSSGTYTSTQIGNGTWEGHRCGTIDSDGDSLLDCWESNGIDFNDDFIVDLPLHQSPYNANPLRKDLFVEIDYADCALGGCSPATLNARPTVGALLDIEAAFAQAPVSNPDASTGISLHSQVDEAVVYTLQTAGLLPDLDRVKLGIPPLLCGTAQNNGHAGTVAERSSPNCENALAARRMSFRYSYFTLYPFGSSGQGELPGNDFLVSVAGWLPTKLTAVGGRTSAEAGTYMHEIGHTLGLYHGGFEGANCKSNYLSVMNYTYQFKNLLPNRPLDFSRSALGFGFPPAVNEAALNEQVSIGGDAAWYVPYLVPDPGDPVGDDDSNGDWDDDNDGNPGVAVQRADLPIDWNGDGVQQNSVASEVNGFPSCGTAGFQNMVGAEDWQALEYGFRHTGDFEDGAHVSSPVEMTDAQAVELAGALDFDGDGLVNGADNCAAIANGGQEDVDLDGQGDACEPVGAPVDLAVRRTVDDSDRDAWKPFAALALIGAGALCARSRLQLQKKSSK